MLLYLLIATIKLVKMNNLNYFLLGVNCNRGENYKIKNDFDWGAFYWIEHYTTITIPTQLTFDSAGNRVSRTYTAGRIDF